MNKILVLIISISIFITSCTKNGNPKPREYFRITMPLKTYQDYNTDCPYFFRYPNYANILPDKDANTEPCWININLPTFKAKIYISYKTIDNNIEKLTEDSRTLAYKHNIKADAINEILIENNEAKVYGIYYQIKGNAASPAQFYLTDSIKHFLRGSLYFDVNPNKDSLAPAIDFLVSDIDTLINSFYWK